MKTLLCLLVLICTLTTSSEFSSTTALPSVTLNTGFSMPVLGLGTWTLDNKTAEETVYFAIQNGYRLIDTARYYGNEKGVGRAIKRAVEDGLVKRKELVYHE